MERKTIWLKHGATFYTPDKDVRYYSFYGLSSYFRLMRVIKNAQEKGVLAYATSNGVPDTFIIYTCPPLDDDLVRAYLSKRKPGETLAEFARAYWNKA
jgi:hypothetical protein